MLQKNLHVLETKLIVSIKQYKNDLVSFQNQGSAQNYQNEFQQPQNSPQQPQFSPQQAYDMNWNSSYSKLVNQNEELKKDLDHMIDQYDILKNDFTQANRDNAINRRINPESDNTGSELLDNIEVAEFQNQNMLIKTPLATTQKKQNNTTHTDDTKTSTLTKHAANAGSSTFNFVDSSLGLGKINNQNKLDYLEVDSKRNLHNFEDFLNYVRKEDSEICASELQSITDGWKMALHNFDEFKISRFDPLTVAHNN